MPMKTLHPILIFLLFLFPSALFAAMQEEETENRPFAIVVKSKDGNYYAVKAEIVTDSPNWLNAVKVEVIGNKVVLDNSMTDISWELSNRHLHCGNEKWLIPGPKLDEKESEDCLTFYKESTEDGTSFVRTSGGSDYVFRFYSAYSMFRINNKYSYPKAYNYDIAQGYQRSGLSEGKFGTICLPYNVETAEWSGATFYEIVGKRIQDGMVISLSLRKVSELVDGRPYIFKAENETLAAVYGNKEATSALEHNGLVGSLEDTPVAEGMYLISDNMVKKCGTGCSIAANRAYINMDNVPELPDGTINDVVELQMYGIPTEICMPTISVDAPSLYYNLGGHPIEECSKGIRIGRNGIKELVR